MNPPNKKPSAATEGEEANVRAGEHEQDSPALRYVHEALRAKPLAPYRLPHPPGMLGDLARYFEASARYPMREGAILAALALMSGVAGRAFHCEGAGLNLYLLLLAKTGRGKEDMDSGIERILYEARREMSFVDSFRGPQKFASGPALSKLLSRQPSFLSIQSEFGLRIKQLNDPRAPAPIGELRPILLDLYSKSGRKKVVGTTVYSDKDNNIQIVYSPNVTILGESTPGHVYDNLSITDIQDGLLPRTLVMECEDIRPFTNPDVGFDPPEDLMRRFNHLVRTAINAGAHLNNPIDPEGVVPTPEALTLLNAIQKIVDTNYNDDAIDIYHGTLMNRAALNIKRVAALVAIGDATWPGENPVLRAEHVDWALQFVSYCINDLSLRFREGIIGTGEERQEAELRKYILEYVRMTPKKRHYSYRVPKNLMEEDAVVTLDYLRRRARQCKAFADDRRGFNAALSSVLDAMVRSGSLIKWSGDRAWQKFGTQGEVYVLGNAESWT